MRKDIHIHQQASVEKEKHLCFLGKCQITMLSSHHADIVYCITGVYTLDLTQLLQPVKALSRFQQHCKYCRCHWAEIQCSFSLHKKMHRVNQLLCPTVADVTRFTVFTARCTLVQSAVLLSCVVCLSVCL